jgi:hypothetical protein
MREPGAEGDFGDRSGADLEFSAGALEAHIGKVLRWRSAQLATEAGL